MRGDLHIGMECQECHYTITSWPRTLCHECEKLKTKVKKLKKSKMPNSKKQNYKVKKGEWQEE